MLNVLFSLAWVLTLFSGPEAASQSAGSARLSGSVHRDGGDKAPAAVVVISTRDGRVQRITKTTAAGGFAFEELPAGSYVIQGCAEAFGPSAPANVELKAGMHVTQDLTFATTDSLNATAPSCLESIADAANPSRAREYTG